MATLLSQSKTVTLRRAPAQAQTSGRTVLQTMPVADAEPSDSAESAGPSGDDEPNDEAAGLHAGSRRISGAAGEAEQTSSGRKRKRTADVVVDAGGEDDTAFSDGEEAPLMSPEGVAAATAGLEEPSSEDDDEDGEGAEGGGRGKPAWGGMLAEAGDSDDDSDAEDDDGARLRCAAMCMCTRHEAELCAVMYPTAHLARPDSTLLQGVLQMSSVCWKHSGDMLGAHTRAAAAKPAEGGEDKDAGAFKSSAKGAAVARAFARIMEKTRPDDRGLSILSVPPCVIAEHCKQCFGKTSCCITLLTIAVAEAHGRAAHESLIYCMSAATAPSDGRGFEHASQHARRKAKALRSENGMRRLSARWTWRRGSCARR